MSDVEHLIRTAEPDDVPALVASVSGLFAEDGARHDPHADSSWPLNEGGDYYAGLVDASDALVLLAHRQERVLGHLVGRLSPVDPLRPTVCGAELESMRVVPEARGGGVGSALVSRFLGWATEHGVNEVRVRAFAANTRALDFYHRWGFIPTHMDLALRSGFLRGAAVPPRF